MASAGYETTPTSRDEETRTSNVERKPGNKRKHQTNSTIQTVQKQLKREGQKVLRVFLG
jgi:hypothetical protein